MPHIEVLPNSTSISAPGYAYVPDTRHGPAATQPVTGRKRAARSSGFSGVDTTVRQQNAVLKHIADLDKESHRDVQIPVPTRQRDTPSKVTKSKTTQNVRRILMSQKTFANHLADEEAAISQQAQQGSLGGTPRMSIIITSKTAPLLKRTTPPDRISTTPSNVQGSSSAVVPPSSYLTSQTSPDDDPLLKSYVPSVPSEQVMQALLSGPPLSYNAARAILPATGKPLRQLCEICGYWGTIKCLKCGARVCGLECKGAHDDGRCLKFYA